MNRRQQEVIEYLKEETVAVTVIPTGWRAPWSHREQGSSTCATVAKLWLISLEHGDPAHYADTLELLSTFVRGVSYGQRMYLYQTIYALLITRRSWG